MILVTGATGLVGRYLVRALLAEGRELRCLVRDPEKAGTVLGTQPQPARGDVTDPGSLVEACRGTEVVIHLVAVIREKGSRTFAGINVEGTRNVVRAAQEAGCRRFIHMSALGVRDDPAYRYTHSKWLAEQAVKESNLDWTIFRPSVIYGDGFGFFDRMLQSLRMSPWPLAPVPVARTKFQPLHAGDLARCVVTALTGPAVVGRTYELGGPEQLTYGEMLDILLQQRGMRRLKAPVPLPLLRVAVPLMERVLKDPPVSSVELKQMELDNVTGPDAVEKYFGFRPRSLREGL